MTGLHSPGIGVQRENPRQDEVVRMLDLLDSYLRALYPPESNHILDIDALCAADIRFFVARREGGAVGCGALRIDPGGYGEIKRMFVLPSVRGGGLGFAILNRIERQALEEGLSLLRLETGIHQHAALALYRTAGYVEREPFGDYRHDPLSLFMEKSLR
jgi:putative acetyltransferase